MAIYDQISYGSGGNAVKKPKKPLDTETYKQMVAFGPAEGEQATTGKTPYTQPATPAAATSAGNGSTQPAPSQSTQAPAAAAPEAVGKGTPGTSGQFSYGDYTKSDAVRQAEALLQQQLAQKPGQYQSPWQAQLDDTIQKIMNREDFSYDFNADALYQQYKDNYIQQGRMAMMDTMGQAQAMTGGYGNSYAQMVGQQAYNQQLGQLNDVIPELYQMAYDRYSQEGQDLLTQYGMFAEQESQDFDRYQTELSNWYSQLGYLTDRYDVERDADYSQWQSGRDQAWEEYLSNKEKEQAAAELMAGIGNYDRLGEVYGLSADEVAAFKAANTPTYTGGGGGSTAKTAYTKLTHEDRQTMQKEVAKAATTGQLEDLVALYLYMGYDPVAVNALTSGKAKELGDGTGGLDTTVEPTTDPAATEDPLKARDALLRQQEEKVKEIFGYTK